MRRFLLVALFYAATPFASASAPGPESFSMQLKDILNHTAHNFDALRSGAGTVQGTDTVYKADNIFPGAAAGRIMVSGSSRYAAESEIFETRAKAVANFGLWNDELLHVLGSGYTATRETGNGTETAGSVVSITYKSVATAGAEVKTVYMHLMEKGGGRFSVVLTISASKRMEDD